MPINEALGVCPFPIELQKKVFSDGFLGIVFNGGTLRDLGFVSVSFSSSYENAGEIDATLHESRELINISDPKNLKNKKEITILLAPGSILFILLAQILGLSDTQKNLYVTCSKAKTK